MGDETGFTTTFTYREYLTPEGVKTVEITNEEIGMTGADACIGTGDTWGSSRHIAAARLANSMSEYAAATANEG